MTRVCPLSDFCLSFVSDDCQSELKKEPSREKEGIDRFDKRENHLGQNTSDSQKDDEHKTIGFNGGIGAGQIGGEKSGQDAAAIQGGNGQEIKDAEHQVDPDAGNQGVIKGYQNRFCQG